MSLPILDLPTPVTQDALVRYFHQTEIRWTEHLGESIELDAGAAFTNPQLPNVRDANRMLMVSLPEGGSADDAIGMVDEHFAARGVKCWSWVMNPSATESLTAPLVERLAARGFQKVATDILYLRHVHALATESPPGVTIIPARASFRHARQLAEDFARESNGPQLADAAMAHLDDPHLDALLALKDGNALATVGVLASGELGRIDGLYVTEPARHHGLGRTMMSRALEICARSLFKHVFTWCDPANQSAHALYREMGFEKLADFVAYSISR